MGGLGPRYELANVGAFSARRVTGGRRHRQQSGGGAVAFLGVGVPVLPTRVSMQSVGHGRFRPLVRMRYERAVFSCDVCRGEVCLLCLCSCR